MFRQNAAQTHLRLPQRCGNIIGVNGVTLAARETHFAAARKVGGADGVQVKAVAVRVRRRLDTRATPVRLELAGPLVEHHMNLTGCRVIKQRHQHCCVLARHLHQQASMWRATAAGAKLDHRAAKETLTAGASGTAEQEACKLLTTRSSRNSSASSAAAARRVCTMSAGVMARPAEPSLASLAAESRAAAGAALCAASAANAEESRLHSLL